MLVLIYEFKSCISSTKRTRLHRRGFGHGVLPSSFKIIVDSTIKTPPITVKINRGISESIERGIHISKIDPSAINAVIFRI
jgi:hypothetical protein